MERWLAAALDYIPRWLEFQMRLTEQPGAIIAVARRGEIVLERAFGHADLARKIALTPRHRLRVASHSKSFTAAGIMKLRERGKLRLDDPAGKYVRGLHRKIAEATLSQLLSHSAGIIRDGTDSGQWTDRRPFLNEAELRQALAEPPILEANTRFKYSNHGYGLLGLVIEAVTHEPYRRWIAREIVAEVGLEETMPDMPLPRGTPFARGHSAKLPLGHRVVIPGENSTNALASATGFISTAADLARWFNSLIPEGRRSPISPASRREMIRRQWKEPHSSLDRQYGLGIVGGKLASWDWFGHSGGFQGYITRTASVPAEGLTVSVLTNASDGLAHPWIDGSIQILERFAKEGAPARSVAGWAGRWWSLWGTVDLLPMGRKVLVASPAFFNPLMDASELAITGRDRGRIALASGSASHGERVRRHRDGRGRVKEVWLAGDRLLPEAQVVRELSRRYERKR